LHKNPDVEEPEINTELLRKYISYAKRVRPILTDSAMEEMKRYYVTIRNKMQGEEGQRNVPITARQLEALVRMGEAFARMKLSDKVTRKEAKLAIDLLHSCLTQVGVDPETGRIDSDIITTGISSSQRSKIVEVKHVISDLEKEVGKSIPIEDVVKRAEERGIDKSTCEDTIEKLKRSGDIFEPKPGIIQKL
jgi:replicative DNA helicase Mcm